MVIILMVVAIMIIIAWNTMISNLTQISQIQHLNNQRYVKVLQNTQIFMVTIYSLLHYKKM